jgi:hypothetical protein
MTARRGVFESAATIAVGSTLPKGGASFAGGRGFER